MGKTKIYLCICLPNFLVRYNSSNWDIVPIGIGRFSVHHTFDCNMRTHKMLSNRLMMLDRPSFVRLLVFNCHERSKNFSDRKSALKIESREIQLHSHWSFTMTANQLKTYICLAIRQHDEEKKQEKHAECKCLCWIFCSGYSIIQSMCDQKQFELNFVRSMWLWVVFNPQKHDSVFTLHAITFLSNFSNYKKSDLKSISIKINSKCLL